MKKILYLIILCALILSACSAPQNNRPAIGVQPTVTPTLTVAVQNTPIPVVEPTMTPTTTTVPLATEVPITWTQVQVAKYVPVDKPIIIDGVLWELPLGTWSAVTTKNGFYEAVPSAPVGIVNGKDNGWCGPAQLDCPPHALLVLVEVPTDKVSCLKAEMDISWRVNFTNTCGQPIPVRFSIRYNDQTRTLSELKVDYLALAGLKQQPLNTRSEVGLFVSVRDRGLSELTYMDKVVKYGYSCWNCLPDTLGPDNPVPYPLVDIETFGLQGTGPTGSSLLPGVVFPLPRPEAKAFSLSFEIKVIDASVVWVGRYDVLPLSPTATP